MLTFIKPPDAREPVLFYEGRHYVFSNFSSFEHAYQAAKFNEARARHVEKRIEMARSAHDAKKIAREFSEYRRPDWGDEVKLKVMEEIVRAKLAQHPFIRECLLETGDRVIIEDSPKDSFWGRGTDWQGHNHLGRLWMKLRAELRAKKGAAT